MAHVLTRCVDILLTLRWFHLVKPCVDTLQWFSQYRPVNREEQNIWEKIFLQQFNTPSSLY